MPPTLDCLIIAAAIILNSTGTLLLLGRACRNRVSFLAKRCPALSPIATVANWPEVTKVGVALYLVWLLAVIYVQPGPQAHLPIPVQTWLLSNLVLPGALLALFAGAEHFEGPPGDTLTALLKAAFCLGALLSLAHAGYALFWALH